MHTPQVDAAEFVKNVEAETKRDIKTDLDAGQKVIWFLGGIGCTIYAVAAAAFLNVHPPTHRLLGKSPDYITIYTTTYVKEVQKVRISLASVGCFTTLVSWYILLATDQVEIITF